MADVVSNRNLQALAAFDDHAVAIARRQYFQDADADLLGMFRRVADWVAHVEPSARRPAHADRFFELMVGKRFCPGGRVLAGAATSHGNVLNCFVQDGRPDPEGSNAWVLGLATKLAVVTKVGGGNGLNLDPLPPKRAYRGPVGRLYLTISPSHADYEKVRDGTFMDLVHGSYSTRGYDTARFVEYHEAPVHIAVKQVGDSVESIWAHAADVVHALLSGDDLLLDLSGLRAEGTPVNGSGGTSSGPSSFAVEVFDNFARWAGLGGADFAGPVATLRYVFAPTLRVIRQGGCLTPETLVHTSRGALRLSELVDPFLAGWQDHHLKVATDDGWRDSPRGFNNGNAPTLIVELANGQRVQGTARHRLKVLRDGGRRAWIDLQDLVPGDRVVTVLDQHTGAPVPLRPADAGPEGWSAPEVLHERLALLVGLVWGDGFMTDDRVGVRVPHGSALERLVPELFAETFGIAAAVEPAPSAAGVVVQAVSRDLVAWWRGNGLARGEDDQLEVPRSVRMAPRPVVAAFLRGLFEAAGRPGAHGPVAVTASGRLAADVAVMLGGLGVQASVGPSPVWPGDRSAGPTHVAAIATRRGLERFLERIGVVDGSRLAGACDEHAAGSGGDVLPTASERPFAGAESRVAAPLGSALAVGRTVAGARPGRAPGTDAGHGGPRRSDGASPLPSDPDLDPARAPSSPDELLVEVRSVSDGRRALTLDLSVDGNKTYLANGVVSHNTRRGAGMATISITHPDVHDFITSKDLQREATEGDISTFNISVLVTDAFMQRAQSEGPQGVLWEIAQHAWQTGEPGLIYVDRINDFNPMRAALGDIKSTNPCVPGDTWVTTHLGARRVAELVDRDFCAVVDGAAYPLESRGFFPTGTKPLVRIRTEEGFELRLTRDHRVLRGAHRAGAPGGGAWCEAGDLRPGDEIALSDHRGLRAWSGAGSREEGWLLGALVRSGAFVVEPRAAAVLAFRGVERERLAQRAIEALRAPGAGIGRLRRSDGDGAVHIRSEALARLAAAFGLTRDSMAVTDEIERASSNFSSGFLEGLFEVEGVWHATPDAGTTLTWSVADDGSLARVQRMLARHGVIARRVPARPEPRGGDQPDGAQEWPGEPVQPPSALRIAGANLARYAATVGFGVEGERARLAVGDAAELTPERFVATVASIDPDGIEDVFDVTVAGVHAFDANGIVAHNCGEIPLFPGEPCDLGAVNLAAYVREQGVGVAGFDVEAFRGDVATAIRFLDNVLEVNRFALEDNREMSLYLRRLGLGIMGLADALIRMGYRYDSEEGREAVVVMITHLREAATAASQALAEERGAFPAFGESSLVTPRRNVALLTVAPTGTTSMLMGVSSGVEPIFAPFVYRKIGTSYAALVAPLFRELLERHEPTHGYAKGGAWDWDEVVQAVQDNHGSVQGLDFVPEDVKAVLVCAHDIAPADHVKMQGVVQSTFDGGGEMVANSISKTINLPHEATIDDVYDAYRLAFGTGCKGITVYRDGSRQFQVLSTKAEKSVDATPSEEAAGAETPPAGGAPAPQAPAPQAPAPQAPAPRAAAARAAAARAPTPRPAAAAPVKTPFERLPGEPLFDRPARLAGFTDAVKLTLPNGDKRGFYVTVNKQDGLPVEVFITSGKAGDEANADSEALGRVVSIALQYGVPAEALVRTLRGINGGMYGTYEGRLVASRADLIAVALETAGVENLLLRGQGCPECGAPLRFEEGCRKCESCGYSKCG